MFAALEASGDVYGTTTSDTPPSRGRFTSTYGRGCRGIRGDLTAQSPSEKSVSGGRTGPDGRAWKRGTARHGSEVREFESCRARNRKRRFAAKTQTRSPISCRPSDLVPQPVPQRDLESSEIAWTRIGRGDKENLDRRTIRVASY
jgi:hypothetical protein